MELKEIEISKTGERSRVAVLQNRQSELQKKIADLDTAFVQQHTALAKTLSEEARTREKQLTEMYEKEFGKVQNVSEQDSQYAFIKSECLMLETLCNSLLSQINQLDLGARLEGLKIYVLAKAVPATLPSSPRVPQIIILGLMLGLIAGVGLAFLRDYRDQTVRSADEVVTILGVPILGALPSIRRGAARRSKAKLRFASDAGASEACRAIRTMLTCITRGNPATTILVTSPGPMEGKTTLVGNLGMAMAEAGQRTLIVNADLRKHTPHLALSKNGGGEGLIEVLMGTAALADCVRTTKISRAGHPRQRPGRWQCVPASQWSGVCRRAGAAQGTL